MILPKYEHWDLFFRGKLVGSNEIELPEDWEKHADVRSITVSITPIGARQNIIVKRVDSKKVYLDGYGFPIECYYHVYANLK
jgi:hypothetical protein